jgi:hypothetical protein
MEGEQNVLWVVQQAMAELGLPTPREVAASQDDLVRQFVALLNRCGYELVQGYPWEQLDKQFIIETVEGKSEYDLPSDWSYFIDQTQWDRTNHWPLLGPKSPQEWQWLKGGLLSSGPRLRYRVWGGKFNLFPTPSATNTPSPDTNTGVFAPWTLAMEYISRNWLASASEVNTTYDMIQDDTNIVLLDPWVVTAYLKLKFREAKGLDATAFKEDFINIFWSRTGKNKGAPILTMAPRARTMLIGVNNIPDGSWSVGTGGI